MKTLAFFFALLLPVATSLGKPPKFEVNQPELKIGSITYYDVHLTLRNGNEALLRHRDGSRSINPLELSEDLRLALDYDPEQAKKAIVQRRLEARVELQQAQNEQADEAITMLLKDAATKTLMLKVTSVLSNGLLGESQHTHRTIFLETPTAGRGFVDDAIYTFSVRETGTFSYTSVLGAAKSVLKCTDLKWIAHRLKNPGATLPE